MGGHAVRDVLTVTGEPRLGLDGAVVAAEILRAGAGKSIVEPLDEGGAKIAPFGCLVAQHVGHVAAPVLVLAAIAAHADGVGRAERGGQLRGIAEIVRATQGNARLGQGFACPRNQ